MDNKQGDLIPKLFKKANSHAHIQVLGHVMKLNNIPPLTTRYGALQTFTKSNYVKTLESTKFLFEEKKIAIAGSGPAGLEAAILAILQGYKEVTVFDSRSVTNNGTDSRYQVTQYSKEVASLISAGNNLDDNKKQFTGFKDQDAFAVKDTQRRLLKMCYVLAAQRVLTLVLKTHTNMNNEQMKKLLKNVTLSPCSLPTPSEEANMVKNSLNLQIKNKNLQILPY